MKQLVIVGMVIASLVLTSCNNAAIQAVNEVKPLTFEEVARSRVENASAEETEAMIYQYVTDRLTIDIENLISTSDAETAMIQKLFGRINTYLQGDPFREVQNALDPVFANYILHETTKTPYFWEQNHIEILGFDPATRRYFVDVTYRTTDRLKPVIPKSMIPAGSPNVDLLLDARYKQYHEYLDAKKKDEDSLASGSNRAVIWPLLKMQFEQQWGNIEDILESQGGLSLLERLRKNVLAGYDALGVDMLSLVGAGLGLDKRMSDGFSVANQMFGYHNVFRFDLSDFLLERYDYNPFTEEYVVDFYREHGESVFDVARDTVFERVILFNPDLDVNAFDNDFRKLWDYITYLAAGVEQELYSEKDRNDFIAKYSPLLSPLIEDLTPARVDNLRKAGELNRFLAEEEFERYLFKEDLKENIKMYVENPELLNPILPEDLEDVVIDGLDIPFDASRFDSISVPFVKTLAENFKPQNYYDTSRRLNPYHTSDRLVATERMFALLERPIYNELIDTVAVVNPELDMDKFESDFRIMWDAWMHIFSGGVEEQWADTVTRINDILYDYMGMPDVYGGTLLETYSVEPVVSYLSEIWHAYYEAFDEEIESMEELEAADDWEYVEPEVEKEIYYLEGNEIGGFTYTGLVNDYTIKPHAELVMRYVLAYTFNLGEQQELYVDKLYLKSYDIVDTHGYLNMTGSDSIVALDVLKPIIDMLLLTYNRSVDSSNDVGLYEIMMDYGDFDKYYADARDSTYMKHMAYVYRVLSRSNGIIRVRVDQTRKVRAKGSEMAFPTYDEVLLLTLGETGNDALTILAVDLLKSDLVGEPLTVIRDVVGVSEKMLFTEESFTQDNEAKVMEVLKEFSKVQLGGGYDNENYLTYIDTGISSQELTRINDILSNIDADQKVTYLSGYITRSNVFVSLKLREIFIGGETFDTEAIIDLVNRNGDWRIVSYRRTLNIKVTGQVSSSGSLFITNKDGTITMTERRGIVADEDITTEESTENAESTTSAISK